MYLPASIHPSCPVFLFQKVRVWERGRTKRTPVTMGMHRTISWGMCPYLPAISSPSPRFNYGWWWKHWWASNRWGALLLCPRRQKKSTRNMSWSMVKWQGKQEACGAHHLEFEGWNYQSHVFEHCRKNCSCSVDALSAGNVCSLACHRNTWSILVELCKSTYIYIYLLVLNAGNFREWSQSSLVIIIPDHPSNPHSYPFPMFSASKYKPHLLLLSRPFLACDF